MRDWQLHLRSALDSGDPDRIRQAAENALEQTPGHVYAQYTTWQVEHQVDFLIRGHLEELEFSVDQEDDGLREMIRREVEQRFTDRVYNALVGDDSFWSAVDLEIQRCDPDPFMEVIDDAVTTVAEPTIEEMFEDEGVLTEVLAFVKHLMENAAATVIPSAKIST
jgi:hypothetical protein